MPTRVHAASILGTYIGEKSLDDGLATKMYLDSYFDGEFASAIGKPCLATMSQIAAKFYIENVMAQGPTFMRDVDNGERKNMIKGDRSRFLQSDPHGRQAPSFYQTMEGLKGRLPVSYDQLLELYAIALHSAATVTAYDSAQGLLQAATDLKTKEDRDTARMLFVSAARAEITKNGRELFSKWEKGMGK